MHPHPSPNAQKLLLRKWLSHHKIQLKRTGSASGLLEDALSNFFADSFRIFARNFRGWELEKRFVAASAFNLVSAFKEYSKKRRRLYEQPQMPVMDGLSRRNQSVLFRKGQKLRFEHHSRIRSGVLARQQNRNFLQFWFRQISAKVLL